MLYSLNDKEKWKAGSNDKERISSSRSSIANARDDTRTQRTRRTSSPFTSSYLLEHPLSRSLPLSNHSRLSCPFVALSLRAFAEFVVRKCKRKCKRPVRAIYSLKGRAHTRGRACAFAVTATLTTSTTTTTTMTMTTTATTGRKRRKEEKKKEGGRDEKRSAGRT